MRRYKETFQNEPSALSPVSRCLNSTLQTWRGLKSIPPKKAKKAPPGKAKKALRQVKKAPAPRLAAEANGIETSQQEPLRLLRCVRFMPLWYLLASAFP
jgi:hypothetical protein